MRPLLRAALSISLCILLNGRVAAAWPQSGSSPRIESAVGIYVTPRGQETLSEHLQQLIFLSGFEIDQGAIRELNYSADDPIQLDQLPVEYRQYSGTLGSIREVLKDWLKGFQLNDPKISARLSQLRYGARFSHLSLKIDTEANHRMPEGEGLALVFNAEIPDLRIEIQSIKAKDEENSFLGELSARNVWAQTTGGDTPLTFQVKMSLKLDKSRHFIFKIDSIESNLDQIQMELGFRSPLQLPELSVRIGGQRHKLSSKKVEEALVKQKDTLLKALQKYTQRFGTESGPTRINEIISAALIRPFSEVNQMSPPGAPIGKQNPVYHWDIFPQDVRSTSDFLRIVFSANIEDRTHPLSSANSHPVSAPLPPDTLRLPPNKFDAAISIHQDLVNRTLELGFRRGYFDSIPVSEGEHPNTSPTLLAAPEFHFDGTLGPNFGRLHLRIRQNVSSLKDRFAIRDYIDLEFDVITRLTRPRNSLLQVQAEKIDPTSIRIDNQTVRYLFKEIVSATVQTKVEALNETLARQPIILVSNLPIPNAVAGIPLKLSRFETNPSGHGVFYFEFKLDEGE